MNSSCGHDMVVKSRRRHSDGERTTHDANDEFNKSLCILPSGLRAATSRHVVSATMAHLLVSFNGTRFIFSHDFGHLLVTQLEATLEGLPINV